MSAPECALPGVLRQLLPLQAPARPGRLPQPPLAALQHLDQHPGSTIRGYNMLPRYVLLQVTRVNPNLYGRFNRGVY